MHKSLSLAETFGLTHPSTRAAQVKLALGGDPYTPPTKWGVSSLKIFKPTLSVKTWLGWRPSDRLLPISSLFNHTQTPVSEGWSVRKTQVQDFRGGTLTYNSHNGTDFAIPPGTLVLTPAAGIVRRISDEFHRGGLKVIIDHGDGLITTSNHLGRTLVEVGQRLERGEPIAISAYSGIDGVISFPWSVPHVHFNTWLNGVSIDPFARGDEESIWLDYNDPKPPTDAELPSREASEWDLDALEAVIDGCADPRLEKELKTESDLDTRAINTIFMKNYFPTRFKTNAQIYAKTYDRAPALDLPFGRDDYDGIRLLD